MFSTALGVGRAKELIASCPKVVRIAALAFISEDRMLSSRLAVVSAILMLAAACGGGSSSAPASPSPVPSPAASPAPPPGASSSAVTIPMGAATLGNRAYNPDDVNVAVGASVTWTNTDSVSHTSTSDVSGWDSGIVAPGGQFSFSFQTAGTFRYHCAIHPGMVGSVVVR
jgi:plastocyanin